MQWSGEVNAGFTDGTPWITPPDNFKTINAAAEALDEDSILHYYKKLIRLRKDRPVISDGRIEFLCEDRAGVFAYRRVLGKDALVVYNNLTGAEILLTAVHAGREKVIGNYPDIAARDGQLILRPYESIVFQEK